MPGTTLCDKCKIEIERSKAEIKKGGVPWKCEDCGSEGVIKYDSEFSIDFRKEHPTAGITFSRKNCPVCRDIEA